MSRNNKSKNIISLHDYYILEEAKKDETKLLNLTEVNKGFSAWKKKLTDYRLGRKHLSDMPPEEYAETIMQGKLQKMIDSNPTIKTFYTSNRDRKQLEEMTYTLYKIYDLKMHASSFLDKLEQKWTMKTPTPTFTTAEAETIVKFKLEQDQNDDRTFQKFLDDFVTKNTNFPRRLKKALNRPTKQ